MKQVDILWRRKYVLAVGHNEEEWHDREALLVLQLEHLESLGAVLTK